MKYRIEKHRKGWALYFGNKLISTHKTMRAAELAMELHWKRNAA